MAPDPWSVVELRQYTLHPGQRDVLIELFDREFVEAQEAAGMRIVGQFRDVGDPDRFVWIRGFPDMESRRLALTRFYVEGETWRAHGPAASATMVDSTNVQLLRPVTHGSGFATRGPARPPVGATELPRSLVVATCYRLHASAVESFTAFFAARMIPMLQATGVRPLAHFETEPAQNTFPRLPVRTGEHVFVWFALFADPRQQRSQAERLEQSADWIERIRPELLTHLTAPEEQLMLAPTARSQLR